ncbi:CRE-THK-1 protein [Caenorhabditis remanei]|nr:CRE-THK-1 protein [Caenorhabditis remanei]
MDAEAVKNEMTCCSSNSSLSDFNTLPRCPNRVGSITVILGPMFSGKTTELLRLHDRQIIAKRTCVLVKYAGDTRYDADLVATHSKMTGQGRTVKAHRLDEVSSQIFSDDVQVVSIDEGQFFDDLAETCEELAQRGKVVCVAALNGTFERKPFPQISLLLPYANEIKQVTAVCVECGSQANFSFRSTLDKKVEVIGGADTYTALCRECYVQKSEEKDAEEQLKTGCDKNENDITGIVMAKKEQRSDGSVSPPRKKIGLSKSVALESTVRI